MAKLWEVLKAFDEGMAIKATRYAKGRLVDLNKNPQNQGVNIYFDGKITELKNDDFEATDWRIIERLHRKAFRVLQIVFQSHMEGRTPRLIPESIENDSLDDAIGRIRNDYTDETLTVLSAVGITEEGETIILVQEGDVVE